jgi:hypothetical protein
MKTSKTFAATLFAVSTLALAGCNGPQVQVPNGYVAKLVTKSGMSGDVIQPSMFRLNAMCTDCDRATLLEVSDRAIKEPIEVFMPKDQLKMNFDMTATVRIPNDPKVINNVFDRVPSQAVNAAWTSVDDPSRVSIITFDNVYGTYGQDLIREVSRSIVAKYSINQILEQRETIAAEIFAAVREKTKGTPIEVMRMSFGAITLPDVIATAKERGAEREEQLRSAEANKQLALKQQEIELIEADTVRQVDQKLAQNISPVILQQRWLKIMEILAGNNSKTVYVMPAQAFGDPSIMMPTLNKAMSN